VVVAFGVDVLSQLQLLLTACQTEKNFTFTLNRLEANNVDDNDDADNTIKT
jgi:hypothetical protein